MEEVWSHVNENEKQIVKILKLKILKETWSGDMVDRELHPKFGLGSCSGFRENLSLQMDRRMTDDCATTVALLTKSSRAKKWKV